MILCYITDRSQFPGSESARRKRLLAKIAEAARAGVDYIQLREKDLSTRELELLAREAMRALLETRNSKLETRLLINSRADVVLATGAHGVHLRSEDISPREVRALWALASRSQKPATRNPLLSVSCHTVEEVARAASDGARADFALFGPVFEKSGVATPRGLDQLRRACRRHVPVLALGGVTLANARACLDAGARGIAAIRLFQQNDIASVVRRLQM
ncbi:MAG: thiamine phosphate synthase [Acidobacteriota bacterium]|nr:thiamine phosphate synthase [Acidobacteriota bacterium]